MKVPLKGALSLFFWRFIMKIYYVEDEQDLASIIKKYLMKEGYEVSLFESGEDAIDRKSVV